MALSMGEERILAEIEQHLMEEDPALAQRLESFGRRSWQRAMDQRERVRLRRWGILGVVVLLAALFITMIVSVARDPGKQGDAVQPYRAPVGSVVVVPPTAETTASTLGQQRDD